MRKKLLNNNQTGSIAKGGVLYRPGELPTLTKEQIAQANLVSKLPKDFPFANWESMNTKQQLQQMRYSGLNDQDQWSLLNTNVPLSVLDQHNQAQDEIETRASATRIAATLMNAVAQATATAKAQAAVGKPTISTPLQTNAQQRKLDMKQEEYETRFYEKAAARTNNTSKLTNPIKTPPIYKPVESNTQPNDSDGDNGRKETWIDKLATLWDNVVDFFTPEKSTPEIVTIATVPPKPTPKSMEEKKDDRWAKIETSAEKKAGDTLYPRSREKNPEKMQPFPFPTAIPVLKDVPYPPNGEKACVFYTNTPGAAFKRQAEYQRKVLESLGYDVELIRTDNVDIFQTEWNDMDPKTTTAIVISHCNGMSLIFKHDSKTNALSATGYNKDGNIKLPSISGLNGPEISSVYLYACNAGIEELMAYKGTNVADAFRDLPNVDTVYAFDGSVGFGPPSIFRSTFEPRLSHEQNYDDVFTGFKIPEEYGVSGESGLLEYDSFD